MRVRVSLGRRVRGRMQSMQDVAGWIDPRRSWAGYLVATGIALALGLALLDPSASRGAGLAWRVGFWVANVGLALLVLEMAQLMVGRLGWAAALPPLAQVAAAGAVGALAFAPLALGLENLLPVPGLENAADALSMAELGDEIRKSAGPVVLFWVLLNTPRLLIIASHARGAALSDKDRPAPPAPSTAPAPELVELLARLPRALGHDIVAVTAELHYLRVHTPRGNALILMSFGRAVRGLTAVPGQVIHRSHWVALAHVAQLEVAGHALLCRLDTGLAFPVSRAHRPTLRAALAERQRAAALRAAHHGIARSPQDRLP